MIRWSKVLAIGLVVYSTAVIALIFASGRVGDAADDIYFIPVVTGTLVGAFLAIKRPDNRMGPLMAIMAAALVTLGASNVLFPWALEQGRDTLAVVGVQLSDLAWVTHFVTALVLLPVWSRPAVSSTAPGPGWDVSPLGRRPSPRSRSSSLSPCRLREHAVRNLHHCAGPMGHRRFCRI